MNTAIPWSRILLIAGFLAMLIGALDPMEGSLLILPGSGLVVLGSCLGGQPRSNVIFRMWVFFLILIGVSALWIVSAQGGIGGDTGLSMWWGLLFAPYLIAWSVGIWGPGSPRWVLWAGIPVGLWYLALLVMTLTMSANQDEQLSTYIFVGFLAAIGALTIGGCIYRLRKIANAKT